MFKPKSGNKVLGGGDLGNYQFSFWAKSAVAGQKIQARYAAEGGVYVKTNLMTFTDTQWHKVQFNRSDIPAITHIDFTARIQTVHKETNPRYYDLLKEFKKNTNCSVLVNTSFNVRGEPIVCSIQDAFNCFMGTNLDVLVINNFILKKIDQKVILKHNYKNKYELD